MSNLLNKKNVVKVKDFLNKKNIKYNLIVLDETARTAENAAKSLNTLIGSIVKSLLFKNLEKEEYFLCLVSGDKYLSLEKLSKITKCKIRKADAEECRSISGFSIGGVSPIAHNHPPSRTFIDVNLSRFDKIFAAAGHPFVIFETSFNKLCEITKSENFDIVE